MSLSGTNPSPFTHSNPPLSITPTIPNPFFLWLPLNRCRREHALSCGRAFTTLDGDEQFDQYGNFQRKDVMKQVHGSSDTVRFFL